ncbi:hypothetical protein D9M68_600040 [compost metagenome]
MGDAEDAVEQGVLVGVGAVDQAQALRLFTADAAASVRQLAHHAVADDARQALQGTDVGRHADVDLLDGKLRVDRGVAHVAGRDQVDGAAQAVALDGGDDRLAAVVDDVEGLLQFEDLAPQGARIAPGVRAELGADRGEQHQVDAGGEMLAGAGQHHDPHFIVVLDLAEDFDDLLPEIGIHRVDLFGTVDLHMGDLVCQLYAEGFVVGHGSILGGRHR